MEHKDKKSKLDAFYALKNNSQIQAAVKDVDFNKRIVTGFFSTYNVFDSDDDVILEGALTKSVNERGVNSQAVAKIKHCIQHDLNKLCGRIVTLEDRKMGDVKGLYFETKMSDTTLGRDTLINYQEKIYDNHSIGFRYMNIELIEKGADKWDEIVGKLLNPADAEEKGYLFACKELMMYEGSTVAFGANSITPFLGVKSGNKESLALALINKISALEKCLKSGMQSDEMLSAFETQSRQLKQAVLEMSRAIPSVKEVAAENLSTEKKDENKDENTKEATLDISSLVSKFSLASR